MAERFDQGAAQFVCDFVERLPTTGTGERFKLYPWQREAMGEFYGRQVSELGTEENWLRK